MAKGTVLRVIWKSGLPQAILFGSLVAVIPLPPIPAGLSSGAVGMLCCVPGSVLFPDCREIFGEGGHGARFSGSPLRIPPLYPKESVASTWPDRENENALPE